MKPNRLLVLAGCLAVPLAQAASPVGTWTGKIQMKTPALPANLPPAQKANIAKMMAQIQSAKLVLTLKADKTYAAKTIGGPAGAPPSEGGTWSVSGNVVTVNPKKGAPKKLTLSKDGKTMTIVIPNGQGRVVFTR